MLYEAPILIAKQQGEELETMKRAFKEVGLENPIEVVEPAKIEAYLSRHTSDATALPLFCVIEASASAVLDTIKKIPLFLSLPVIVLGSRSEQAPPARSPSTTYWPQPETLDEWVQRLVPLRNLIRHLEDSLAR